MNKAKAVMTLLVVLATLGCRTANFQAAREIEGNYVRVDKPEITLMLQDGHFRQGATNIHAEGTYTARKLGENKYELRVSYHEHLEGAKGTIVVRKEGDCVFTQDDGEGPETKFQRR